MKAKQFLRRGLGIAAAAMAMLVVAATPASAGKDTGESFASNGDGWARFVSSVDVFQFNDTNVDGDAVWVADLVVQVRRWLALSGRRSSTDSGSTRYLDQVRVEHSRGGDRVCAGLRQREEGFLQKRRRHVSRRGLRLRRHQARRGLTQQAVCPAVRGSACGGDRLVCRTGLLAQLQPVGFADQFAQVRVLDDRHARRCQLFRARAVHRTSTARGGRRPRVGCRRPGSACCTTRGRDFRALHGSIEL